MLHSSLQASRHTELDLRKGPIFVILKYKCAHLKFSVYGRKQTNRHTHARAQCSHASVGLAQARPNKPSWRGSNITSPLINRDANFILGPVLT